MIRVSTGRSGRARVRGGVAAAVAVAVAAAALTGAGAALRQSGHRRGVRRPHARRCPPPRRRPTDRERLRAIFECSWVKARNDEELLDSFVAADTPSPELSAQISALMAPCLATVDKGPAG